MILIILGVLLVIGIIAIIKFNVSIDVKSFFRKGLFRKVGQYGVFCFSGKQGSGKTYSATKFLYENYKKKTIYANYTVDIPYKKIKNLDELLQIKENDCIIFYDEIFTEISRSSRLGPKVLEFLAQMRKRQVVFITTCQEWLELPVTLRRFVRFHIPVQIHSILGLNILVETYEDAEQMKWDNLQNEYLAPTVALKISKLNKKIAQLYDTWEVIRPHEDADASSSLARSRGSVSIV